MKLFGHTLSKTGVAAGGISILGILGAAIPALQAVQKACPDLPASWLTAIAGAIAILGVIVTFFSRAPEKAG